MSIQILDLRGRTVTPDLVKSVVPRAALDIGAAVSQVAPVVEAVRTEGVAAINRVSAQFDGFIADPIWATAAEFEQALATLEPNLKAAIEEAASRVRATSVSSMPTENKTSFATGAAVTTRYQPIESVGLYVPGGKAVYPSSVVMNVVPAQVAGVAQIVIATPGQKALNGRPHPTVLAASAILGVDRVLVIGGPAAIAAMAYGVSSIGLDPVDLITGPGNIFVAAAKRIVRGQVAIDSEAGTTEVLVLADETANARAVALDLISQAEHDEAAASVLVTDSKVLANNVFNEIESLVSTMSNEQRIRVALSGQQSALVIVESLTAAIDFANSYATEHLEIMTGDDQAVLSRIKHAGAIFVGEFSPVALGDYMAGSNHVLPTGGTARFNAGLGVHTFLRSQQVIDYSQTALATIAAKIDTFARAEGLDAHGRAITDRLG
ncbi:MAG: histidinol dehydrogenase [Micrococcales bacterium]